MYISYKYVYIYIYIYVLYKEHVLYTIDWKQPAAIFYHIKQCALVTSQILKRILHSNNVRSDIFS